MKRIKREGKFFKKPQPKPVEISLSTGYTKRPEPTKSETITKTAGSLFARGAEFFSSLKSKQPEKPEVKKTDLKPIDITVAPVVPPANPAPPPAESERKQEDPAKTESISKETPSEKTIKAEKPIPAKEDPVSSTVEKAVDSPEKPEPPKTETKSEAAAPAPEPITQTPPVPNSGETEKPSQPEGAAAPKPEEKIETSVAAENKTSEEKIEDKKPGIEKVTTPVKQDFTGSAIMEIDSICKSFVIGEQTVQILKNVSFKISEGDFMVVFGPSGCGKSTLLHTILGLEPPTSGRINFMDNNLYENTNEDDRAIVRKQHVGMIYQQPNWIKSLTVIENVMFPLTLLGTEKSAAQEKSISVLKQVQMENWANYHPAELSSGQQQRIAMARALVNNPMLIVADEPTGNLDYDSGQLVMQLFADLNEQQKKTIVMVTHDLEYLKYSKTAVRMLDGQVVGIYGKKEQEKLFQDLQFKRGFLKSADSKQ